MPYASYADAAKALRRYLNDVPQLNELDEDFESTDDELEDFIKQALNTINMDYAPATRWTINDVLVEPGEDGFLPWSTVRLGAILELLTTKGIGSARNMLTFSDSGGVEISHHDKWGRYINYYNVMRPKFEEAVKNIKIRFNTEQAYGGFSSPFSFDVY
jgi:hypothetical protein